jgi:hypothetical protein
MPMTDIVGFLRCELMIQWIDGVGKDHRRVIQKTTAGDSTLLIRLP